MLTARRSSRLACLLLLLLPAACGDGAPQPGRPARGEAPPVEVTLEAVRTTALARSIEVTGTLFGEEEATISAKMAGRIAEVLADVGDPAAPGAPLARLETTDYELALAERRAALLAALARLGLTDLPSEGFDPSEVPAVARARAEAANAEARFQRGRMLFEETPPLISEEELADLRTAWDVAVSSAAEALVSARATLADARTLAAQVAVAGQRLAETTISAPGQPGAPGPRYLVAERLISPGEYVTAGHEAFRVVARDLIKFRADVPERFSGRVRVGQEARVLVESAERRAPGRVARVSPSIDAESRTFQVEVHVPNEAGELRPGAFARGEVLTHADEGVVMVPRAAVVTFAGVHKVYSVRDGKAVEHRVRLGQADGDWVEVVGGLPVDRVVTVGAAGLADGVPVIVGGG